MAILRTTYNNYVNELQRAKARIKRDREIIKLVHKMINKKALSDSETNRLDELIFEKT